MVDFAVSELIEMLTQALSAPTHIEQLRGAGMRISTGSWGTEDRVSEEELRRLRLLCEGESLAQMKVVALPVQDSWLEIASARHARLVIGEKLLIGVEAIVDDLLCRHEPARKVQINLELSGKCNLRCHYCSLDQGLPERGKGSFLSLDTLRLAFDRILNNPRYEVVGPVCLWNGGEPLLHPAFDAILDGLAAYQRRHCTFALITNGTVLSEARVEKIIQSGVISELVFSLDGGTPELFEQMRAPAKWPQVARRIEHFLDCNDAAGRPVRTTVNMVLDPSRVDHPLAPEFAAIVERVDRLDRNYPQSEAGNKPADYVDRYDPASGLCAWLKWRQYVVLWNGKVTMCCSDLNGALQFGHVDDFDALYDGAARRQLLRAMVQRQRHLLPGCAGCNQPELLPTSDGTGFWDRAHVGSGERSAQETLVTLGGR